MRKFKLLKFYPSLNKDWKEGLVVIKDPDNFYRPVNTINSPGRIISSFVEDYPDYWEEIIEKDYEILEMLNTSKSIYCVKPNEDLTWELQNHTIHKIRRKSDGVEFKIGDKLDFSDDDDKCYKSITEISLNSIGKDGMGKRTVPWLQCGKDYGTCLEYAQLVKEPILITEDGYECTLDNRVFGVLPKGSWDIRNDMPVKGLFDSKGNRFNVNTYWKFFKIAENRDKYIYENKPEFSRKQILNIISKISINEPCLFGFKYDKPVVCVDVFKQNLKL